MQNRKLIRSYLRSAATFGIADGADLGARLGRIAKAARRPKSTRIETFEQAVERLQLSEVDIQARAAEFSRIANRFLMASLALAAALLTTLFSTPSFLLISFLMLLSVWTWASAVIWQFRHDQVKAKELFSFKQWLRSWARR